MAAIAVNHPGIAGKAKSQTNAAEATSGYDAADAATYDTMANDGETLLEIESGSGSARTVTVYGLRRCSQGFMHDQAIAVAANATVVAGPFDPGRFGASLRVTASNIGSIQYAGLRT